MATGGEGLCGRVSVQGLHSREENRQGGSVPRASFSEVARLPPPSSPPLLLLFSPSTSPFLLLTLFSLFLSFFSLFLSGYSNGAEWGEVC